MPTPAGPLENHHFEGNPLRQSKVEQLTQYGWIEIGKFPATVKGLARACRLYGKLRNRSRAEGQPPLMGVALWVGPALAACELSQSIRSFYGEGPPAPVAPTITVEGHSA